MKWIFYNKNNIDLKNDLKKFFNYSDFILDVFINRGFDNYEKINKILNIDKYNFHSPFLFENMESAIKKIDDAIKNNKKITIYGDYDVDGVTAIAILIRFFKENIKYANIDYYIPNRHDEGYGLNNNAILYLKNNGTGLIITVDCGINSKEQIKFAKDNGLDIIITDHHIPDISKIPDATDAIINPKFSQKYPDKELSGVGVAYKLICALAEKNNINIGDRFLDFVALGTIADIVPLSYENRMIIRKGLNLLKKPENLGLFYLKQVSELKSDEPVSTYHIGYILGPRINAAGRLEHAKRAVELFLTDDETKVKEIADYLNNVNQERKKLLEETEKEALKKLESSFEPIKDFVLVLYDENWNSGIIGLVASKLVRKFFRPAFVFTKDENGFIHGSARSIYSVNIYDTLKYVEDLTEKFGGHKLAAGVVLKKENLENFRKAINEYLINTKSPSDFEPILYIDAIIKDKIDITDIRIFEKLQPWGEGNPEPVFLMENVEIKDVKLLKKNTLKFYGSHNNKNYNFIIFNYEEEDAVSIKKGSVLNLAVSPSINKWNDLENLVFEVKDYKN